MTTQRRAAAARRRAALKGWQTRRARAARRSRAARKGWRSRREIKPALRKARPARKPPARKTARREPKQIDYLVTLRIKSPKKPPTTRDLIVPGPPGLSRSDVFDLAEEIFDDLPSSFFAHARVIDVATGPATKRKKARRR